MLIQPNIHTEQYSFYQAGGMREQKWLELKICRSEWELLQEDVDTNSSENILNTTKDLEAKQEKRKIPETNVLNNDIEKHEATFKTLAEHTNDKICEQFNDDRIGIIGYNSDDEFDEVSENVNMLQSSPRKANFLERQRFLLTIIFLTCIVIIIITVQFYVYWTTKDQKITQNNTIFSPYDIM